MKILITLLTVAVSVSSVAEASWKSKLAVALEKVAVHTIDQEKLVQNFNQALMTTRRAALDTGEGSQVLLSGSLQDKSHFVVELVSTVSDSQVDRVALRLSSNTKNPALFSDMFLTLKTGPGMPRIGSKGEMVGVLVVDTKNLSEVNQRLVQFLNKAQNGGFNSHMIMSKPVLSRSSISPIKGSN